MTGSQPSPVRGREPTTRHLAGRLAKQIPFTLTVCVLTVGGTIVSRALRVSGDILGFRIFATGYVAIVSEGRWWSPLTSVLAAGNIAELVLALLVAGVVLGFAERRMGLARVGAAYVLSAFVSVWAGVGVEMLLRSGDPFWVAHSGVLDALDPVRPVIGVAVAASAFCDILWRRRIRVVVFCTTIVLVLYAGHSGNISWLASAVCGLLLGFAFRPRLRPVGWLRSSHHEVRVLVSSIVAVTALGPLVAVASSTRFGVLAPIAMLADGDVVPQCDRQSFTTDCLQAFAVDPARHSAIVLGSLIPITILLLAARSLLRGHRAALWTAIALNGVLGLATLVTFLLLPALRHDAAPVLPPEVPAWPGHVALALSALAPLATGALLLGMRRHFTVRSGSGRVRRALLLLTGTVRAGRPAAGSALPLEGRERARILLEQGGGALSHIATWPGNGYWFTKSGRAGLAYRVIGDVALTCGGPFGMPEAYDEAVRGFARFCDDNGWSPVVYSADRQSLEPIARSMGWRLTVVAQEAVLDAQAWSISGKRRQDVRTAVNRARKTGVTALWTRYRDLTLGQQAQIAEISEEWMAGKSLPEMSFTLGGLGELADPDVRLMIAVSGAGRIDAVTSWMPFHDHGVQAGWTLDFMRRRRDAMSGVMEFLIRETVERARLQGLREVSLSGAPLARLDAGAGRPTALDRTMDRLGAVLESHYGFASLMRFKDKFGPSYRPLVMAYPDPALLGGIGLALLRAYLPTLSLRRAVRLLRP